VDHDTLVEDWRRNAELHGDANYAFLRSLKFRDYGFDPDELAAELHERAFGTVDCTRCANCCKTLEIKITDDDVQRGILDRRTDAKPQPWLTGNQPCRTGMTNGNSAKDRGSSSGICGRCRLSRPTGLLPFLFPFPGVLQLPKSSPLAGEIVRLACHGRAAPRISHSQSPESSPLAGEIVRLTGHGRTAPRIPHLQLPNPRRLPARSLGLLATDEQGSQPTSFLASEPENSQPASRQVGTQCGNVSVTSAICILLVPGDIRQRFRLQADPEPLAWAGWLRDRRGSVPASLGA
jgi:hypothetical protein